MNRLSDLLDGYLNKKLTPTEEKEFFLLLQYPENQLLIKELLPTKVNEPGAADQLFRDILRNTNAGSEDRSITEGIQRRVFLKLSIAALIFLLGAIGIWLLSRSAKTH